LRVAAIIPTYNERENIQILIPRVLETFGNTIDGEVVIVDDASPDGTGKVAEELAGKTGKVSVMNRPGKMGLGSAYKDGFRYALSKGFEGVIEMDADLSHDQTRLPEFVRKLEEGYDLIIGSRYIPGGSIPKWSWTRRLVSNASNRVTKFLLGLEPKDVTSGFRAYSTEAIEKINLSTVKSDGYAFQVEMVMRCQRAGLRICEIPIAFVDREQGESKLSRGEMWRFLKSILRLTFTGASS